MGCMRSAQKTFIPIFLMSTFLIACWDKTELNELALVSMIGVDSDPESGWKTIYYQIINPLSGTSAKGTPGGNEATIYTYEVRGRSYGEIKSTIYKILPRKLFVAHYKVLIVSQRAARQGIRDIVNFIEMQPNGRSSVPLLVADGPISQIMRTFTPLERIPSDVVDSKLKFLARDSLIVGKHIKVRDVIERMQKSDTIVLPVIKETTETANPTSGEISAEINANKNNLIIDGGAVFRDYRMVGRLNDAELIWYHLLSGDKGRHARLFQVDGKRMTVEMKLVHMDHTAHWRQNKPVVTIHLDLELSSTFAVEFVPQSQKEVKRLEQEVAQLITDELDSFCKKIKDKGWDLLGIRETVERSHRKKEQTENVTAIKNVDVMVRVNAKLLRTGSMSKPY